MPEPVGWALSLRRKDVRVRVSPRALCPRSLMDRTRGFEPRTVGVRVPPGAPYRRSPEEKAVLIRLFARVQLPPPVLRAQGQTVSRPHDTRKIQGSTPWARTTRGWSSGWASVLHADEVEFNSHTPYRWKRRQCRFLAIVC